MTNRLTTQSPADPGCQGNGRRFVPLLGMCAVRRLTWPWSYHSGCPQDVTTCTPEGSVQTGSHRVPGKDEVTGDATYAIVCPVRVEYSTTLSVKTPARITWEAPHARTHTALGTMTTDPSGAITGSSRHPPNAAQYRLYATISREACRRLPGAATSSTRIPIPGGWRLFAAPHSNASVRSPAHDRLGGDTAPESTGGHARPWPVASEMVSIPPLFVGYASMLASWEMVK